MLVPHMGSATRRLLLVEEDASVAAVMKDQLTAAGHEVIHATRGEMGFARAVGGDFHAVLASATAPGLGGPEMVRRLAKERPGLPVIILAGEADAPIAIEAGSAGAAAVLRKPTEGGELLFQVHRVALEPDAGPERPTRPHRPAPGSVPAPPPFIPARPSLPRAPGVLVPRPLTPVARPPVEAPPVIDTPPPPPAPPAPRIRVGLPTPPPPAAPAVPPPATPLRTATPAPIPAPEPPTVGLLEPLIGDSQAILALRRDVDRAMGQPGSVRIDGPSGTGHHALAEHLRLGGPRATGPRVVVDCSAFSQTQLDTELFGHERGATAGADDRRRGACERASHGTLILDQVHRMALGTQLRVLRCLQERRIQRLGGQEKVPVDIEVIALSEVDLDAAAAAGVFRQDLLDLLGTHRLRLPALADRPQDIPLLARHYVVKQGALLGLPRPVILQEAIAELRKADWPGNLDQLETAVRLALLRSRDTPVAATDVREVLRGAAAQAATEGTEPCRHWISATLLAVQRGEIPSAYDPLLRQMEHELFSQALRFAAGNVGQAAAWVGLPEATLRERLRQLKLGIDEPTTSGPVVRLPAGAPQPPPR